MLISGRMRGVVFWAGLCLLGIWYVQDVARRDAYVYAGVPRLISYSDPANWVHVITNPGFMLGYSEIRRNPLWVTYHVRPVTQKRYLKRPDHFSADWRTFMRVGQDDYRRSGYDRGHLAPNYVISQLYGREAQLATFRMSNITPQRPELNQALWQRLEEVEVDHFARHFGELWVTTGPLFDADRSFLPSGVEIPDAFYRVILNVGGDSQPRVLAFIVPQTVRGTEPLTQFVVTVDEIEQRSGFDLFAALPDVLEERLESSLPDRHWRLEEVSRLAPRYRVKK